ncbi:MAG: phage tail sheath C-terminal domain-containing protein [Pseudomonadota bacterium]
MPEFRTPGVFVQELPSDNTEILAQATSITAFIGRTQRGAVNTPTRVTHFNDFQTKFGDLHPDSTISYTVRQFFQNGGGEAVILRLVEPVAPTGALGNATVAISPAHRLWMALDQFARRHLELVDADVSAGPQGSPDLAALIAQMKREAAGLEPKAAKAAAAKMIAVAEAVAPARQGDAQIAAYAAAFAVPRLMYEALKAKDNCDPALYVRYADHLTKVSAIQEKAQQAGATAEEIVALARQSVPDWVGELAEAAQQDASALDLALHVTRNLTQLLLAGWRDTFYLQAANPGAWGNSLSVTIDQDGITEAAAKKLTADLSKDDLFNLTARYAEGGKVVASERFQLLTVHPKGGDQRLDRVLERESMLLRVPSRLDGHGAALPDHAPADGTGGLGQGGWDSPPLSIETYLGNGSDQAGINALSQAATVNIVTIPPDQRAADGASYGDTPGAVYQAAAAWCAANHAMLIIDPPNDWAQKIKDGQTEQLDLADLGSFSAEQARSAAVYFPRLSGQDVRQSHMAETVFPPSGAMAGVWAATDLQAGVWKAPAGVEAALSGFSGPEVPLNDAQNGVLNPKGINCIRSFQAYGTVAWGARTLLGADDVQDDYKYISVRRLTNYIEQCLDPGLQWVVFEPNEARTWEAITQSLTSFLRRLFLQGAFAVPTAADAYFVRCDGTTTTQQDIQEGRINVLVGFAPNKPAEFIVLRLTLRAGS